MHCRRTWTVQSYSAGGGNVHPRLLHANSGPPESHVQSCIAIGSAVFAQHSRCLYFTMGRAFPPQNCPCALGDQDPHLIHGSLGPSWVHNPNSISIGSAVFAGLTSVTHWLQTDRLYMALCDFDMQRLRRTLTYLLSYSMCNNRPHLASAAMRPKNWRGDGVALSGIWHNWVTAVVTRWSVSSTGEQYALCVDREPGRVWHRDAQTSFCRQIW